MTSQKKLYFVPTVVIEGGSSIRLGAFVTVQASVHAATGVALDTIQKQNPGKVCVVSAGSCVALSSYQMRAYAAELDGDA